MLGIFQRPNFHFVFNLLHRLSSNDKERVTQQALGEYQFTKLEYRHNDQGKFFLFWPVIRKNPLIPPISDRVEAIWIHHWIPGSAFDLANRFPHTHNGFREFFSSSHCLDHINMRDLNPGNLVRISSKKTIMENIPKLIFGIARKVNNTKKTQQN